MKNLIKSKLIKNGSKEKDLVGKRWRLLDCMYLTGSEGRKLKKKAKQAVERFGNINKLNK